jgi:peroxiredoxin
VVAEWGVMREDVAGYRGMPMRSIFVLDPHQVVRWTWTRSPEQPLPDYDEVIAEAARIAEDPAPA